MSIRFNNFYKYIAIFLNYWIDEKLLIAGSIYICEVF